MGNLILRQSFAATQRVPGRERPRQSENQSRGGGGRGGVGSFNWNYSVCVITGSGIREISNNNY